MKKKIYIIGFMGTGKSYWGKVWAKKHQMPFMDLDSLIEEKEKGKVLDIFEQKGEEFFREVEADCLRSTLPFDNSIIACGGGAPCSHNSMEWMNENGLTILLEATPAEVFENIKKETRSRPLLKDKNEGEIIFFIEKLMNERKSFYDQAQIKMPVKNLTAKSLDIILQPNLDTHHA